MDHELKDLTDKVFADDDSETLEFVEPTNLNLDDMAKILETSDGEHK